MYGIIRHKIKRGEHQMENFTLFNKLINEYTKLSFAHLYILGFRFNGNIYMTIQNSDILNAVCKLDKASRGYGYAIRYNPNKAVKIAMLKNAVCICSEKFFDETVANTKYNKGEIFEKFVTEYYGQVWTKDNVPFTKAGDIVVNGIHYQIKFEKATFANEYTLNRAK